MQSKTVAGAGTNDQHLAHRLAVGGDMRDVYQLYMDPSSNRYLTYDPMEIEEFRDIYEQLIQTSTLFVVELNGGIVGSYRIIPKTHRQSQTWYLGGFVVGVSHKGQGIGYRILQHIRFMAESQGIRRIELTVSLENKSAINLYKKAGYETEGTIKSSYRLGNSGPYFDEYLMAFII
jgi:RimJ/RimL family protein N-acetyltransferase